MPMGNPHRCPKCNGLGSSLEGNICRKCDREQFYNEVYAVSGGNMASLLTGALLEVGAKSLMDVRHKDRERLIGIIRRRNTKARRHIVGNVNPREFQGGLPQTKENYGLEKGVPGIESLE